MIVEIDQSVFSCLSNELRSLIDLVVDSEYPRESFCCMRMTQNHPAPPNQRARQSGESGVDAGDDGGPAGVVARAPLGAAPWRFVRRTGRRHGWSSAGCLRWWRGGWHVLDSGAPVIVSARPASPASRPSVPAGSSPRFRADQLSAVVQPVPYDPSACLWLVVVSS